MRKQEPANDTANDVIGRQIDVDIESLGIGEASSLEKNDGEG